ncbi:MAG: MFS transporter [Rudaea sp.]
MTKRFAAARLPGPLAVVGSMYFFVFMGSGAFTPFINLYFSRLGFSGVQIGSLAAIGVLVGTVAAFFWAALADGYRLHNRILSLTLLLTSLSILLIYRANGYDSIVVLFALVYFAMSPVLALIDSSTLELVKLYNSSYGAMRLWGSIGWSVSTWVTGWLIQQSGAHWLFYGSAAALGVTFVLSFLLPPRLPAIRTSAAGGLRRLIRGDMVIFLVSIFLLSATSSAVTSFFSIYLDHIGADEALIGLNWTFAAVSEIPLMFYSGALIKRFGAGKLLAVSFALYALRWFLYSFIEVPVLVLAVQLIGGFSFALFLTSGIAYVSQRAPAGLTTTALLIFNTVVFGVAGIAGSMAGGYLFDQVGMQGLFRVVTLLALAGLGLFALAPRAAAAAAPAAVAPQ